jgi:penicillin-binding protein 1A
MTPRTTGMASDDVDERILLVSELPSHIPMVNAGLYDAIQRSFGFWWNKTQGRSNAKLTFDRVSKKKATECTPDGARIELDVIKTVDPITKAEIFTASDGYDASKDDDAHSCDDGRPSIGTISVDKNGGNFKIMFTVTGGTFDLSTADIVVDGRTVKTESLRGKNSSVSVTVSGDSSSSVTVNVVDAGYYTVSRSENF